MYGFPTQTIQDTVDALNTSASCLNRLPQSGFFHRFACTVHSPVGRTGRIRRAAQAAPPISFARTTSPSSAHRHEDATPSARAQKGLYNFMHMASGLEQDGAAVKFQS